MKEGFAIAEAGLEEALQVLAQLPEFDPLKPIRHYQEQLEHKPHLILVSRANNTVTGCKIGYDRYGNGSFYSWLGGVLPEYRNTGTAKALAMHQESWAKDKGYKSVRFRTQNRHKAMLLFAIKSGFKIYNVKAKDDLEHYRIELIKEL